VKNNSNVYISHLDIRNMKSGVIIGIIIAVLVIGGILFFFLRSPSNLQTSDQDSQNPDQQNPESQNAAVSNQNTAEIDCGTTPSIMVSGELDIGTSFSDAQKQAWNCMTDALTVCNKAKTVLGTSTYKIIGKQNNLCMVKGPSIVSQNGELREVTCGFSQKVIDSMYVSSEHEYPSLKYAKSFTAFNIVTMGGAAIPLQDGTSELVVCS